MKFTLKIVTALLLVALGPAISTSRAQSTAFTYQGRLNAGGGAATGSYDFTFSLYDSSTNGTPQGPILTNAATAVSNGLFTVTLDFGNQFPGAERWLAIAVCTNGAGNISALAPRQPLTASPYAVTAGSVLPGGLPAGTYTNAIVFSNPGNQFYGDGGGMSNLPAAQLSGTVPVANLPDASATGAGVITSNMFVQAMGSAYANNFYGGRMPIYYQSWLSHGSTFSSTDLTNLVNWVASQSYLTSMGAPFLINIDEGWSDTNRDAQGRIQGDPVKWPMPMSTYADYCHQHGIGLILYSENNDHGAAVPSSICSGRGTNIEYDAQTMAAWGMDGCKFDLFYDNGTGPGSNVVMILQRFENAFRGAATNRPVYFISDVGPASADMALWGGSFAGTSFRFYPENFSGDPFFGFLYRLDDALTNRASANGQNTWVFPCEWQDNQAPWNPLMGSWEGKVFATGGYQLVMQALYEASPNQTTFATNIDFWQVDLDTGRHQPWIVPGLNSSSLATWQCVARSLTDNGGGLALCFFSRSETNNYAAAIRWTDLGYSPGAKFLVHDVWGCTNWGIYSNGFACNVSSNDAVMVRLYPVSSPLYAAIAGSPSPVPDNSSNAVNLTGSLSSELGKAPFTTGLALDVSADSTNTTSVVSRGPVALAGNIGAYRIAWTNSPYGPAFLGLDAQDGEGMDFGTNLTWLNTNAATLDILTYSNSAEYLHFGVETNGSHSKLAIYKYNNRAYFYLNDNGSVQTALGAPNLNDGQLHELTGTYNGLTGYTALYVDGVLVSTATIPGGIGIASDDHLALDATGTVFTRFRVWNRDLAANEVGALYQGTFPAPTSITATSLIIRSNLPPMAVAGAVVIWNSNNIAQYSIRPGSTNFNFKY